LAGSQALAGHRLASRFIRRSTQAHAPYRLRPSKQPEAFLLLWIFHEALPTGCVEFLFVDGSVIIGIDLRVLDDDTSALDNPAKLSRFAIRSTPRSRSELMCSSRDACGFYPRLALWLHIDGMKRGHGLGDDDQVVPHFDVEVNLNVQTLKGVCSNDTCGVESGRGSDFGPFVLWSRASEPTKYPALR
jgi:hypothetical protein